MTCRIGINGFGRIGRMVVRRALTLPEVEVVAVNDLARIGDLAYLLEYDSVHGLFPGEVSTMTMSSWCTAKTCNFRRRKIRENPVGSGWRRRGD